MAPHLATTLLARLGRRPVALSTSAPPTTRLLATQSGGDDEGNTAADPPDPLTTAGTYGAADALWPTTRAQKSAAARVRRALAAVLADPAAAGLRGPDVHTLTIRCGLALGGVRTGPDGRSAHILYDVTPGTEAAAAAALAGPLAGPLRSAVGRALGARRAPVLKWMPDRLPAETSAVVAELERLGLPSSVK